MVCGRCGLAGNFRDSHIVAFHEKVMVVRGGSVFAHWRVPLFAVIPVRRSDAGISITETIAINTTQFKYEQ